MAAALAIGTGAAYLGDDAVKELFKGPPDAGDRRTGHAAGNAVPHDGGFLLSGSWSFASGIKHGTHIHTLGIIEGTGEPRIFVLPVEKVKLIDNWNVMGLRATGSIDYTIDSVYVPTATPTSRSPMFPNAAALCIRSASSVSRRCATPDGHAASDGDCSTSRPPRAGARRTCRHAVYERELPRAVCEGRRHLPFGARAGL
jgi:hypothetical protein